MSRPSSADVAFIVAAHNASSTLGSTLASVAAQTELPGAVVVVDDGSDDETASVARAWESTLPIEVVRLERNVGTAGARREAISCSSSPLVAVLDADDYLLPDHLETLLTAYEDVGGLITPQALNWVPGSGVSQSTPPLWRTEPPPQEQLRVLLAANFVFVAALFGRDDYDRAGGFRATVRRCEDWDLWIRMVRAGVRVTRTDHPTVLYRARPDSKSFGYGTAEGEVDVMLRAREEAASEDERRWARSGLRRRQARLALRDAFDAASDGHVWRARRRALRAVQGARRVALQGTAMMISPKRVAHAHRRRMARLERLL